MQFGSQGFGPVWGFRFLIFFRACKKTVVGISYRLRAISRLQRALRKPFHSSAPAPQRGMKHGCSKFSCGDSAGCCYHLSSPTSPEAFCYTIPCPDIPALPLKSPSISWLSSGCLDCNFSSFYGLYDIGAERSNFLMASRRQLSFLLSPTTSRSFPSCSRDTVATNGFWEPDGSK